MQLDVCYDHVMRRYGFDCAINRSSARGVY